MKTYGCLLLALCLLLMLAGCGAGGDPAAGPVALETVPEELPEQAEEAAPEPAEESAQAPAFPEESGTGLTDPALAAQVEQVLDGVPVSEEGFVTQADFYRALGEILALHGVELTPCETGNAHFRFDYANVTDVRLLTMTKTPDQVQQDIRAARQAVAESETGQRPEESLNADAVFDPGETASGDYVTSFVVTSTTAPDDQTLLFLSASAALVILDRNYSNTETAFQALKGNLFNLYNNSGGSAVSWIDGIDNTRSFTIPGNAIECWLGVLEDGNYYLAITPYAQYDEIIDIAGAGGSSLGGPGGLPPG